MAERIPLGVTELEQLFTDHYEGLCRYAYTMVKHQPEAEDIVQRLFITLWEKRFELEILRDAKSYLYRATHNASINAAKRLKRQTGFSALGVNDPGMAAEQSSDVVLSNELQEQIDQAIQRLPEKCGEVFRLSRFKELSYKEIAEHLDLSVKTVENHMGKALRMMRSELADYLPLLVITILLSIRW